MDIAIAHGHDITKNIKADIKVLDFPILNTSTHKKLLGTFIADIVLYVLSYVAQQEREFIKQRQREGIDIALAKGVKFGRKVKTKAQHESDCHIKG